jgi:adenylate cyclase
VNLAFRLEQLTKEHGARLIVSDEVKAALGDTASAVTPLGAVTIKGYAAPVRAWRLE